MVEQNSPEEKKTVPEAKKPMRASNDELEMLAQLEAVRGSTAAKLLQLRLDEEKLVRLAQGIVRKTEDLFASLKKRLNLPLDSVIRVSTNGEVEQVTEDA